MFWFKKNRFEQGHSWASKELLLGAAPEIVLGQLNDDDDFDRGAASAVRGYMHLHMEGLTNSGAMIRRDALELVARAAELGVVLTITQVPRTPLAMRNYSTAVEVRDAR